MEDDLFGDLEVFEHYGVNHTVSELKKEIEGKVKVTLPSELKKITSTFVVEGAQAIENEEYEETIKDVKELSTEGSITTEPNGDVPLQNQDESGDDDGKKEAPPGPKEPEKKYEWVDVVKKRKRPKRTDLAVISPGIHRVFFGVVHMQFINLLCFVYLVDGTTLKDQSNIKVPTLLRNVCEEEHSSESEEKVGGAGGSVPCRARRKIEANFAFRKLQQVLEHPTKFPIQSTLV